MYAWTFPISNVNSPNVIYSAWNIKLYGIMSFSHCFHSVIFSFHFAGAIVSNNGLQYLLFEMCNITILCVCVRQNILITINELWKLKSEQNKNSLKFELWIINLYCYVFYDSILKYLLLCSQICYAFILTFFNILYINSQSPSFFFDCL